jgi:hypothetical protein
MEPVTGPYLHDVVTGRMAASGMPQDHYDPSRSVAANALDPQALEQATNMALSVGPGAIRAYHGSPYDFSRFDISKIGTGEGAQAYGHGLYFAENEAVARGYRDKLAPAKLGPTMDVLPEYFKPGNIVPSYGGRDRVLEYKPNGDFGFAVKVEEVNSKGETIGRPRWHETMPTPQQIQQVLGKNLGHMYEVNINAEPQQFLDWDAPATAQPDHVLDTLNRMWLARGNTLEGREYLPFTTRQNATGKTLYEGIGASANAPMAPRSQLSEYSARQLRAAGVPGLRYLDQVSRGAGEGTSNYVMFDDSLIEILRKYGLLGTLGGGAAAAAGGEAQAGEPAGDISGLLGMLGPQP